MSLEEQGYEAIELQASDEVRQLLEERHVLDDEIKMVIHNAETSGNKLYQTEDEKYSGKSRIGNTTFYAEYSVAGDKIYTVHTAYSHRVELKEE